jgi:uncharacterized membrane-anchored protein
MDITRRPLNKSIARLVCILLVLLFSPAVGFSQIPPINWIQGPEFVNLGNDVAQTFIENDFLFASAGDTKRLMEYIGNPITNREVGLITSNQGKNWFIIFEYDPVGYVKDDEKESIDSDALFNSIKDATDYANKQRIKKGFPPLNIIGWYEEPHYDEESHNLVWALLGDEGNEQVVNYNTRLLGRYGYMSIVLVTDPETLDSMRPTLTQIIDDFSYKQGKTYAEYVQGDKIAKYGLLALVAGGAGATAAKFGIFKFLAKAGKGIIVAIIALFSAAWAKFKSFFSSKPEETPPVMVAQVENKGNNPHQSLLERVEKLRSDGRIEDAIILIRDETRGKIDDLDLSRIYYDLLQKHQQIPELLHHAVAHLNLLSKKDINTEACDVYKECISHSSSFSPDPKITLQITQFLAKTGKPEDAYKACVHFTKVHPNHALIPEAYFCIAKILNENMDKKEQSQKIMAWLVKKFPDHERASDMKDYLCTMS